MDFDTYKIQFEEFAEDADISLNENILSNLSRRAVQLEKEADFSLDDLVEELIDIVPARFQSDADWINYITELANFVFDEKENNDDEDEIE